MKKILIIVICIISNISFSQSYNSEKTSFINFVKRYYETSSFEGVKVVEDYENKYLVSKENSDSYIENLKKETLEYNIN